MTEKQDRHRAAVTVSKELVAAFEQTNFIVSIPRGQVLLRIGQLCDDMAKFECRRVAVVTAYNPFSEQTSDALNRKRQTSLISMVENVGLKWLPASGTDPTGAWPPEPSLAVLDASTEQLDSWMDDFDQHAVVVVETGKPTALRFHPRASIKLA